MSKHAQLKGSFVRRYFWALFILLIGVNIILLFLLSPSQTIYAVGSCDLELVFVIADAETGEPIQNASIEISEEGWQEENRVQKIATLITNEMGTATFIREHNTFEDIERPFRKTVRSIDLTWAAMRIVAEGYESVEQMSLYDARRTKNEWVSKRRLQRVELLLSLKKRSGQ
jgi:hypothetical protein